MFRLKNICIHRLNVCPRKRRNRTRKLWPFGIGLNYPWHDCLQLFYICIFILSRTARWCQYLTNFAFLLFFWGCQKSALIAILKTPCASIFLIFSYDATASSIEHASKCLFVTVLVLVMQTTTTEATSTPTQQPTTAGTCIYNYYIIYSLETEQKTVLNIIFMYKNSTIKTRKQDSKDKHWQLSQYSVGQKLTPNSRP